MNNRQGGALTVTLQPAGPLEPSPARLLALGALARQIGPEDLLGTLDAAAEVLRSAAGADDCEIYLGEPDGGDLLMAACRGRDRVTLLERTRFGLGEGFPGLAAATGQPIASLHLDRDRRFLRRRAVRNGIASFLAAPVGSPQGPVGCACLAWRREQAPVEDGMELLASVAGLLAAAIRSGLLASREQMERAIEAAGTDRDARRRSGLAALVAAAGARGGTLALFTAQGRPVVYTAAAAAGLCSGALDGRLCDRVAEGHGVALPEGRAEWPPECHCLPRDATAPVCLPLRAEGRLAGVAVLDRGAEAKPGPRGRDLVPLLAMAREAARLLTDSGAHGPSVSPEDSPGGLLEIRVLGRFTIRLQGKPIPQETFRRRKAIRLLQFLILSRGNALGRSALIERLWPGVDEEIGANRFHGVLHELRRVLEPSREDRRWRYICNVGDVYYLNPDSPLWIDLHAFRRHATAGHEADRQGRVRAAIQHFESALELYQGDLFADDSYAAWCEPDRAELRRRSVDLMARLADLWTRGGKPDLSVSWLRRALEADPLREDLHQVLIRLLVHLGRRGEAGIQYKTCVRLLREELGAEPLPETRQLQSLLLAGASHPGPGEPQGWR